MLVNFEGFFDYRANHLIPMTPPFPSWSQSGILPLRLEHRLESQRELIQPSRSGPAFKEITHSSNTAPVA